jgi:hypothetical protein
LKIALFSANVLGIMANKYVGIGCLGFLLLVAGLFIYGYIAGNKMPQTDTIKSTPLPEIYYVQKATDLAYSFHSNEVSADDFYKGKTFFIVGEVKDIGKTITGAPYVILKGDEKRPVIATNIDIQVIFERSEKDKIGKIARGDTIKAKATCDGLTFGNVILNKAELR